MAARQSHGAARMRAARALLAVLLPLLLALGAGPAAGQPAEEDARPRAPIAGQLTVLRGEARILRADRVIAVTQAALLEEGDRVQTLAGSRAYVRLRDAPPAAAGMEAMLAEFTWVDIAALRAGPSAAPLSLALGALRARVRHWATPGPFVTSAAAAIGIKGTDFVVVVRKPEASEFIGVEGLIECVSRSRPEFSLRIGPRQWGEIVAGLKPNPPVPVPDALWAAVLRDFAFPVP
jgi:hypothetical protein